MNTAQFNTLMSFLDFLVRIRAIREDTWLKAHKDKWKMDVRFSNKKRQLIK